MGQSALLAEHIYDGRRFVERFAADGNPVQAAFWAKMEEDSLGFLYVATETYDELGPAATYRAVHASLRKLGTTWITSSEIKVISPNDPMTKDVLTVMAHNPGRMSIRFDGPRLGNMWVEQAHIYPPQFFTFTHANPMTTEEIGQNIFRLMNRGPGHFQPSRVVLKDGTAFDGVPFSLDLGTESTMLVKLIADRETAPRVLRIDDIASIT